MCFVRGGWTDQDEWLLIWSDLIFQTRWSGIVGTFRSGCCGRSISTGFHRWERPSKIWMGKIYVPWARKTSDSVLHSAVKHYTHIWIYGNQVKYSDQSTLNCCAKNCLNSGFCKIQNAKIHSLSWCEWNSHSRKLNGRKWSYIVILKYNIVTVLGYTLF